jgi:hypothetical protein
MLVAGLHAQTTNIFFTASNGREMRSYDTTFQGSGPVWQARVTMPVDHDLKTDSTTALVMIVGLGEVGNNWANLVKDGWHYWLTNGWTGAVSLPNGVHNPILITLQPASAWPNAATLDVKVNQIYARYKITRGIPGVKKCGFHASGLSMGGWAWNNYVMSDAIGGPYTYSSKIASIFESCGANPNANTPYPDRLDNFAIGGNKGFGGNLLGYEQQFDGRDILNRVNRMNSNHSGSYYIRTNFGDGGHNNFNAHYDPSRTNWTTGSSNVIGTTPSGGISLSVAQWQLLQGDTVLPAATAPDAVILNPISDFSRVYSYATNPPFSITATVNQGSVTSWSWSQTAGPASLTLSNTTTATVTASNITVAGYYTFQVTGTGAGGSDTKTVTVQIRDLMQKNVNPCRAGGGIKFTLGNTLISGVVTTTQIYAPYITRDNILGQKPLGGDTILIPANPTGIPWQLITYGDVGGGPGCPITVMSDSTTVIGATSGAVRIATQDSNVVAYTVFDGLANRLTKGEVYGWRYDRSGYADEPNSIGFNANLVHDFTLRGFVVRNAGVGVMIKKNSDSSNPYSIYDNFRLKNITIHDGLVENIHGEGFYLGHTDVAGNSQAGNNGPTITGDSLKAFRLIINKTEWDGFQLSNFGRGADLNNIVAWRTGTINQSSQQWSIFIGGNTSGKLYNSVAFNGTGPLGTLGKGTVDIYDNYVDSVNNGLANADGIYVSMSTTGMPTPVDSLQANVYNNIIGSNTRHSVFFANTSGAMKGGRIENNITTKSGGTFSSSVTAGGGTAITGNSINTGLDLPGALGARPEYQVYNLLRSRPAGTLISFFDVEVPVINLSKPVGIKKGHRLKVKSN